RVTQQDNPGLPWWLLGGSFQGIQQLPNHQEGVAARPVDPDETDVVTQPLELLGKDLCVVANSTDLGAGDAGHDDGAAPHGVSPSPGTAAVSSPSPARRSLLTAVKPASRNEPPSWYSRKRSAARSRTAPQYAS